MNLQTWVLVFPLSLAIHSKVFADQRGPSYQQQQPSQNQVQQGWGQAQLPPPDYATPLPPPIYEQPGLQQQYIPAIPQLPPPVAFGGQGIYQDGVGCGHCAGQPVRPFAPSQDFLCSGHACATPPPIPYSNQPLRPYPYRQSRYYQGVNAETCHLGKIQNGFVELKLGEMVLFNGGMEAVLAMKNYYEKTGVCARSSDDQALDVNI